jgi:hypothetical protein
MKSINHNKAVRCVVDEREDDRFPVTVTFESGSEDHDSVKDLEELEEYTKRWEVPAPPVYRGRSWHQLHE